MAFNIAWTAANIYEAGFGSTFQTTRNLTEDMATGQIIRGRSYRLDRVEIGTLQKTAFELTAHDCSIALLHAQEIVRKGFSVLIFEDGNLIAKVEAQQPSL